MLPAQLDTLMLLIIYANISKTKCVQTILILNQHNQFSREQHCLSELQKKDFGVL